MHIADPLSRRLDHYISLGDNNKDQVVMDRFSFSYLICN